MLLFPLLYSALGARSPADARLEAEHELARALPCGCCTSTRQHLSKRLGSTLFLDDNPAELQRALPRAEHEHWTERLLAACILLWGRPRTTLFGRS